MLKRLGIMLLTLVMAVAFLFNVGLPFTARAASGDDEPVYFMPHPVTGLPNTDFSASGNLPASPSGFSGGPVGERSYSSGVVSGVIDLGLGSFYDYIDKDNDKDIYKLSEYFKFGTERNRPELLEVSGAATTNTDVLMINNTSMNAYKYSASVTFRANDYYRISVWVYTCNFNNVKGIQSNFGAYLKLTGDVELSSGPINTNFSWQQYTLLVETSNFKGASAEFSMQVGDDTEDELCAAYGFAFFDKITATSISYEQYTQEIKAYANNPRYVFNTDTKDYLPGKTLDFLYIKNSHFEDSMDGWELAEDSPYINRSIVNSSQYDSPWGGTKKLRLQTGTTGGFGGVASEEFLIERHHYYYISAYVDTTDLESGSPELIITSDKANESLYVSNSNFSESDPHHWRGNWRMASFYIKGSAFADRMVKLELWLGNPEARAKGTVYFDYINVEYVKASDYTAAAGGVTVSFGETIGSESIINGSFTTAGDYEEFEYPLPAASWATSGDEDLTVSGIVPTDPEGWQKFAAGKFGVENNPGGYLDNNNMLMIWNKQPAFFSYTSSAISFGTSSYYKITVPLITDIELGSATLIISENDRDIVKISNINTHGFLAEYNFWLAGGRTVPSVKLTIALGTDERSGDAKGHLFCNGVYLSNENKDKFDAAANSSRSAKYDFSVINFTSLDETGVYVKDPVEWTVLSGVTAEARRNTTFGIVNLNDYREGYLGNLKKADEYDKITGDLIKNGIGSDNLSDSALVIYSTVKAFYGVTYNYPISYDSGMYYRLTFRVKTIDIPEGAGAVISVDSDPKHNLTVNTEYLTEGITDSSYLKEKTFKDDSVNKFKRLINTGYVEYSFYINNATSEEIISSHNIMITLGNNDRRDNHTSGLIIVDSITVKTIGSSEFARIAGRLEEDNPPQNAMNLSKPAAVIAPEKTPAEPIEWWVLPTALLGFVIILVLVLEGGRRLLAFRRKRIKEINTSYDREITLEKIHHKQSILDAERRRADKFEEHDDITPAPKPEEK